MLTQSSNVVAYTMTNNPPRPYRFKSTTLKFQVPGLKGWPSFIQDSKFIRDMSGSDTWKTAMNIFHKILLTSHEVNEIASAPRGLTIGPAKPAEEKKPSADEEYRKAAEEAVNAAPAPTRTVEQLEQEIRGSAQSIATLTKEGKVIFEKPGQQN
ncbi:unnamed protein product [Aspergillus oryzae]|uniref:Unnamed protein product n=2 Tax=Aspergillus oryzae TaxID=5062 RepID=A0AAN4YB99_ASPOZ|nr:unnamed protein product [Aspergillus oryzae]GMF85913.1 unnamed protein product [Aspergillus oryzae]GMG01146.1 unnamed protein product [Aspergillus oryzae]GMG22827.1 unnamed protein product [Aspergillus oryzae]GMG44869.1 unnamed protein product [Aspergillus oryzae var. brunneus]